MFVRLARPILGESELEDLAASAFDLLAREPGLIDPITNVILKRQHGVPGGAAFLARLLAVWPEGHWQARARAITFIERDVENRRSRLFETGNSVALGLAHRP